MSHLLDGVGDRLATVDPRLLMLALALHVANHLLRSVAWRTVIAAAYPDTRVALTPVVSAYATGVALNAVAPARGGDAVKLALARRAVAGSTLATLAATMSVLMAFDLAVGTALVLVIAVTGAVPMHTGPAAAHLPIVLAVLAALGLAGFATRRKLAGLGARLRQGGAILRTPKRYLRGVALVQVGAWSCRVGVVLCLLAAFGLPATLPIAVLVMVLAGASTIVPLTPGGAGTQQVLLAVALGGAGSATAVVSFSLAMQASVTAVNALLGLAGAMAACRTLRPIAATRAALAAGRA